MGRAGDPREELAVLELELATPEREVVLDRLEKLVRGDLERGEIVEGAHGIRHHHPRHDRADADDRRRLEHPEDEIAARELDAAFDEANETIGRMIALEQKGVLAEKRVARGLREGHQLFGRGRATRRQGAKVEETFGEIHQVCGPTIERRRTSSSSNRTDGRSA